MNISFICAGEGLFWLGASRFSGIGVAVRGRVASGSGLEREHFRCYRILVPVRGPSCRRTAPEATTTSHERQGVRAATRFGPQCMQARIYGDMVFRNEGRSEDCLYLNVWSPTPAAVKRLPVLVYVYGGGFMAGNGSKPRYDGENIARQGLVVVTAAAPGQPLRVEHEITT